MAVPPDQSFLGTGWTFPPRFERHGRSALVANEPDIRESLFILLSTVPGERVMHPTFGCGLQALVFESVTGNMITRVKDMVARAILHFEPRITLERIEIDSGDIADGLLKIGIDYRVRATNSSYNMVYPFYIDGGAVLHA
jgi:phage baseplate assembly protein W